MGVDHRRRNVLVAEQLLDSPDVVAILEQVRGEAMAQDMRRHGLGQPGLASCLEHRALDDFLIQMVPSHMVLGTLDEIKTLLPYKERPHA